ncbi:MAG: hydroxyacylglutathione hydrolase [Nitratireductor sp.]
MASAIRIHQFPCLSDNYGVLLHSPATGETISIDAPDAAAVLAALSETGWKLTHILVTHHHADHVQGMDELKQKTGCMAIGPANPAIKGLDRTVADGDSFELAGEKVSVIATPGHTLDMLNYHFPASHLLFAGDTLFAMGCGRVFEGTPEMMWNSLQKLMKLPPETQVYCGHEYTLSNAKFAIGIDANNPALQARLKEVEAARARNEPTIPTTIGIELQTNPFLRAADREIRAGLAMQDASDAEVFAEIRERKNRG